MAIAAPLLDSTPPPVEGFPAVRSCLEFIEPEAGTTKWTVFDVESDRYLRLGAGAVTLLRSLDGTRSADELAGDATVGVPALAVPVLLKSFSDMRLLVGTVAETEKNRRTAAVRRLTFERPLTVRWSFGSPAWLRPSGRLARFAHHRATGPAMIAVSVVGVLSLIMRLVEIRAMATTPTSWQILVGAAVLSLAFNALHELGHGATLAGEGARPRRFGLMLFYLCPSMFCDVTDAWRLPDRRRRARVMLAGPLTQSTLAGLAAVTGLLLPSGSVSDALTFAGLASFLLALGNLLPLIKLDGYYALSNLVDIPNLRSKSIADVRTVVTWTLIGGKRPALALATPWLLFGLGSIAFPVVVVARIALHVQTVMIGTGRETAIVWLVAVVVGLGFAIRYLERSLRLARRVRPFRTHLIVSAFAVAVGVGLGTISVPSTTFGVATEAQNGTLELRFLDSPVTPLPEVGANVSLVTVGLLGQREVGTANVAGIETGSQVDTAFELFLPVRGLGGGTVPTTVITLDARTRTSSTSAAYGVISTGDRSAARWIYDSFVGNALSVAKD